MDPRKISLVAEGFKTVVQLHSSALSLFAVILTIDENNSEVYILTQCFWNGRLSIKVFIPR
jgi:hypothetical protein